MVRWWSGDVRSDVDQRVSTAVSAGTVAVLVAYNIPNRDRGRCRVSSHYRSGSVMGQAIAELSRASTRRRHVAQRSAGLVDGVAQFARPAPTAEPGKKLVDAYLWVKRPGESDGTCNGGPAAGGCAWSPDYALGLAQRALLE